MCVLIYSLFTWLSFMWNWLTKFCNSCETDSVQSINSEFLQWHRYRDVSWMKFLAIYRLSQNCCIVILSSSWAKYCDSILSRGTWWYPALLFSTLLIPVFCVSALAYSGGLSPDLWQEAPGWRRLCIWLWWLVGIAWMRPSPWSNRPSCSASRRSRFTFLLRILWLHSLKKRYVSCTGLMSFCSSFSQCKGAKSDVLPQRPWWQVSLFSFYVYFFNESSDLWFNPAHVKHSLSLCDRWYQDQSTS